MRVHDVDPAILQRNIQRLIELNVSVDGREAVPPGLRTDSKRAEVLDLGGCIMEDQQQGRSGRETGDKRLNVLDGCA